MISAQFMLDSESRLREAIQKMLEARQGSSAGDASSPATKEEKGKTADDDLDMSGMTMETQKEELDMTEMTMEEETDSDN